MMKQIVSLFSAYTLCQEVKIRDTIILHSSNGTYLQLLATLPTQEVYCPEEYGNNTTCTSSPHTETILFSMFLFPLLQCNEQTGE